MSFKISWRTKTKNKHWNNFQKLIMQPGTVKHICNFSIREAKVGELPVLGQPEMYSDTLSQKTKGKKKKNYEMTEG
jgi:hypothetical protein